MLIKIIAWVQPITVIAFLLCGICKLLLKEWQLGVMNCILALFNFICFYGHLIFKK